jgi:hypothetical protein
LFFCTFNYMNMRFVVFLACCLLFACRRDGDTEYPTAQITLPVSNQVFHVGDTMHVKVKISDNQHLEYARFQLVDANLIPALTQVPYTLNGRESELDFLYPIDDIHLTSGLYYLKIEMSDGANSTQKYQAVQLIETPRSRLGLFAVTHPQANAVNIYKIDTSWNASLYMNFASDYGDFTLSDYWQQLYFSGSMTGPLRAISIDGSSPSWQQPSQNAFSPWFGNLQNEVKNTFVCYPFLKQVKRLDLNGSSNYQVNTGSNTVPENVCLKADRLFVSQYNISNAQHEMAVFSFPAGGGLQQTPIGFAPIALIPRDSNLVYVLGNANSVGFLAIYDFSANGFWTPLNLPAATVRSAVAIDESTLLIGMSDGVVYKFSYNPLGLIPWVSSGVATHIRYDETTNEVYASMGSVIRVYDYTTGSLQQTITLNDSITDFEIWHNR